MKFVDKIVEVMGLYDDDEILDEEEQAAAPKRKQIVEDDAELAPAPKKPLFERKDNAGFFAKKKAEVVETPKAPKAEAVQEEVEEPAPKKTMFPRKQTAKAADAPASKTIAMPLADKQVSVDVMEPASFDHSQKIADYLRNNQPVVVNFENTDSIITKRMTDFVSGTIYALGGSMKKIGRSILVCAPKNVDIDAGISIYDEKGGQPWNR